MRFNWKSSSNLISTKLKWSRGVWKSSEGLPKHPPTGNLVCSPRRPACRSTHAHTRLRTHAQFKWRKTHSSRLLSLTSGLRANTQISFIGHPCSKISKPHSNILRLTLCPFHRWKTEAQASMHSSSCSRCRMKLALGPGHRDSVS